MKHTVSTDFGGRPFSIESGEVAKQASGSVVVRYGDTMVLVTAVALPNPREGADFLPLTVNYQEKFYAAGKIPGSFFRREARPSDRETLTSRLIDRPIRPLFPDHWHFETQIMATVLSFDGVNEPSMAAMAGASAALEVSDIPFRGPIAGIRLGRVDGKFIVNPAPEELDASDLDLVLAASRNAIVMVEAGAKQLSEAMMLEALEYAHKAIQPILDLQEELRRKIAPKKREVPTPPEAVSASEKEAFTKAAKAGIAEGYAITEKQARYARLSKAFDDALAVLPEEGRDEKAGALGELFENLKSAHMRGMILDQGKRVDGRDLRTVRPISITPAFLPRTHGSVLFTRGETQAIVVATLGTTEDEQKLDHIDGIAFKKFMLHYNFPPYSVGETSNRLAPGRREIGHGALAERAIKAVLPSMEEFAYTIRVVSDITESNGSSSMATVCGGSLALMDGGVPIKAPVAGVAMGLILEGNKNAILTDILGDEDHLGDMDFKVAGTEEGITALQMDIKVEGITSALMKQAMDQAKDARLHVLGKMREALPAARPDISPYAPRITTIQVPTDRIRDVIGPGGKVIKEIIAKTGCSINIEDDGRVHIASADPEAAAEAIKIIQDLTRDAEVGMVYKGRVTRIMDFGAFIEILPGVEGLVHVSQLDFRRVPNVTDVCAEGEEMVVKCIEIDQAQGRIRLSRKEALYIKPED
ncbi:MAG: polyribonucleotide nucleotidyltransferase, partial [Bdellovibrionota bacterium]